MIKWVWDEILSKECGECMIRPQFFCDTCGERIEETEEAIVTAKSTPVGSECEHMGVCAELVGVYHKLICDLRAKYDGRIELWWDLDDFCKSLSMNYPVGKKRKIRRKIK